MSQNVQWNININGVRKFKNNNYIPYEILIRGRRLKFKIAFQCVSWTKEQLPTGMHIINKYSLIVDRENITMLITVKRNPL